MKTRTYNVLSTTYDVAYDLCHTTSYVRHATSYVTYDIVRQTYDIVSCDIVCPEDTLSYIDIVCSDVQYRICTISHVKTYDIARPHRYYTISYGRHTISYVGKNPDDRVFGLYVLVRTGMSRYWYRHQPHTHFISSGICIIDIFMEYSIYMTNWYIFPRYTGISLEYDNPFSIPGIYRVYV